MLTIIDENLAVDFDGVLTVKLWDEPDDAPPYAVLMYKEKGKSNTILSVEQHKKVMEILKEKPRFDIESYGKRLDARFSFLGFKVCQFGDAYPCKHKECQ